MKNLTTFLYGLLLIALGIIGIGYDIPLESLSDYVWCAVGVVIIYLGFIKLRKSTK